MNANKFELFLCCLGNGITVCNKAVTENNDYKIIAHISNNGIIKLYVSADYIPSEDMKRIQQAAEEKQGEFLKQWNNNSLEWRYLHILDNLNTSEFLEAIRDKSGTFEDKVKRLEDKYLLVKEF
jgi:hypothetical protein|nr:MAG TPA: hypothetical protein [Caudoviricetes sp.]